MRWYWLFVGVLGLTWVLTTGANAPAQHVPRAFPYVGYINSDQVNVRSGPGDNYYPVLRLRRGDAVEVYRHDPGGWYAIRPPAGSFSWVSAEFVQRLDADRGVVCGDRVLARVGSEFSDVRDVIQVRLHHGEEVQILEARRSNDGSGTQGWYKIAAPAGEFRWVAGQFVDRRPEDEVDLVDAHGPDEADRGVTRAGAPHDGHDDYESGNPDRWGNLANRSDRLRRSPTRDLERFDRRSSPDDSLDRRVAPAEYQPDDYRPPIRVALATSDPGRPARPPAPTTTETITIEPADVEDLELALSALVLDNPRHWNFTSLRDRAQAMLLDAETAVDRGRLRAFLQKIERFEQMAVRHGGGSAPEAREPLPILRGGSEIPLAVAPVHDPRFDGTGRLAQVVARDPAMPSYALLDEEGRVRCYVTPAPGVSLRAYLGREVGVHGTLGYLSREDAKHVTAKRITTLR